MTPTERRATARAMRREVSALGPNQSAAWALADLAAELDRQAALAEWAATGS